MSVCFIMMSNLGVENSQSPISWIPPIGIMHRFARRVGKQGIKFGLLSSAIVANQYNETEIQTTTKFYSVSEAVVPKSATRVQYISACFIDSVITMVLGTIFIPLALLYVLFRDYRNLSIGNRIMKIKAVKKEARQELSPIDSILINFEYAIVSLLDFYGPKNVEQISRNINGISTEILIKSTEHTSIQEVLPQNDPLNRELAQLENEKSKLQTQYALAQITRLRFILPWVSFMYYLIKGSSLGSWPANAEYINDE